MICSLKSPDWISLSGLIFIWLSIAAILSSRPFTAIILTMFSFIVDMLDGWVSRKQKNSSQFGLQLDTIVDTLNYPIFCSIFSYVFLFNQSWVGSVVAVIILIFCSLRLSRMAVNGICLDNQSKKYYEGVVTPHLLLAVIVFFFISHFFKPVSPLIVALVLITLSTLMVTKIKTYKPKSLHYVILIVIMIILISFFGLVNSGFLL